ncbi:hypothetical protein D3C76_829340 [compost metagenome]
MIRSGPSALIASKSGSFRLPTFLYLASSYLARYGGIFACGTPVTSIPSLSSESRIPKSNTTTFSGFVLTTVSPNSCLIVNSLLSSVTSAAALVVFAAGSVVAVFAALLLLEPHAANTIAIIAVIMIISILLFNSITPTFIL